MNDGAGPAPGSAGEPAVRVSDLVKRYEGRAVVDGVSLEVAAGELVALLGPNGAGKTTTVEIVEGYRRADGGTVRVLGVDPAEGGRDLRARVGLMLQGGGIDPRARPRETLVQYGRFHATPRPADELVDLVGLGAVAATPYRRLSGGERQRLSLALALVGRPEVLVLDEPTAGMDPEARAVTRGLVAAERAGGAAILLTSHDLTEVERLADRLLVIDAGRAVFAGTPAELTATAGERLTVRLDRPLDETAAAGIEARLRAVAPEAHVVAVVAVVAGPAARAEYSVEGVPASPELVAATAAACAEEDRLILELRTGGGSLEDAYLALLAAGRARVETR